MVTDKMEQDKSAEFHLMYSFNERSGGGETEKKTRILCRIFRFPQFIYPTAIPSSSSSASSLESLSL